MTHPASKIVLSEVDSEIALLGSLFMAQSVFERIAGSIRSEWFSDGFLRYMFDASCRLMSEGVKLSPQAVVSTLPEDCGGVPRGAFYARVCSAALPADAINGMISIIKDRWARRTLLAQAAELRERADQFSQSPYELASEIVVALDSINADRAGNSTYTFDAAMDALASPDRVHRGATTGLAALDNKLSGYVPGQLYVFAGRPGMGKSAMMCSSLRRTAQSGKGVAIFSLEMTSAEIAARCVSDTMDQLTGPSYGSLLRGAVPKDQRENVDMVRDSLSGLPLIIEDEARLTWIEIVSKARQAKARLEAAGFPLAVVCIDHLGLVTPSDRYRGNKVAEAGEISGQARALAKDLNCCVLLLSQLSRDVEKRDDKRPTMADLRWSGEIEQDAHVIGFLYREAYYMEQDANVMPHVLAGAKHKLDFLIRKNRNGETADVSLWCSMAHSMIRDDV